uniref:Uncharacterized protein n=1 Tax=Anguilla anguilla TaxID=7936 RepID=A0A0E9XVM5_ANGAN
MYGIMYVIVKTRFAYKSKDRPCFLQFGLIHLVVRRCRTLSAEINPISYMIHLVVPGYSKERIFAAQQLASGTGFSVQPPISSAVDWISKILKSFIATD